MSMSDVPQQVVDFHSAHAARSPVVGPRPDIISRDDVERRSGLPWLALDLPVSPPHERMLEEARRLRRAFVPHRAKGGHRGWYSLCLHGISAAHTESHDQYGYPSPDSAPFVWTDIARLCPVTTAYFREHFGYRFYHRVRFMLLEPGGYILPHVDSQQDRLSAINLALNNPVGCDFVMENHGTVPFAPGVANILSLSNRHIVWNRSTEDRIHMIIHGMRDEAFWSDVLLRSYSARFA